MRRRNAETMEEIGIFSEKSTANFNKRTVLFSEGK